MDGYTGQNNLPENTAAGASFSPARWYECSFCRRGFSTAQALGGHMNMHKRDRAKILTKSQELRGVGFSGQFQQHGTVNLMPRGEGEEVRTSEATAQQLDLELRLWPESAGRK